MTGRFSETISADDLVFGNAFDRPIRVRANDGMLG